MAIDEPRPAPPQAEQLPEDKRPEAGRVQSANPEQTGKSGPEKLDAEEVNDAEAG
jgi:hypothetical protein